MLKYGNIYFQYILQYNIWILRIIFRHANTDDFMNSWNNYNIYLWDIKDSEPKLGIYGNGYIERKINVSGYKDLSIQYALRNSGSQPLESNDYCGLYSIQNGFKRYIHQWNWNDIDNLDGLIQLIYLPKLFDNADNICIGFNNNGTDGWYDRCYVTVTIFQGISKTPNISATNELDNNSDKKEVNIKTSTKTSTLIIIIIVSIIIIGCCLLCKNIISKIRNNKSIHV